MLLSNYYNTYWLLANNACISVAKSEYLMDLQRTRLTSNATMVSWPTRTAVGEISTLILCLATELSARQSDSSGARGVRHTHAALAGAAETADRLENSRQM